MTLEADFKAVLAQATSSVVDDEAYWAAAQRLLDSDAEQVWALVSPLALDGDARLRALVPDVLRPFGSLRLRTVALLRQLSANEGDPRVLAAIGAAFNELGGGDGLDVLESLLRHPEIEVRRSAVPPLMSWMPEVAPRLIALSADDDDEIRNWATFSLAAAEPFLDTPAVRDALAARLHDPHSETRAEAVLGLAVRGDRRCVPVIAAELERGPGWDHYVEACEFLPDARFVTGLERVVAAGTLRHDARDALARCRALTR